MAAAAGPPRELKPPQYRGLAWILQKRMWRRQWQHAADVAATVAALPTKNPPWRP